MVMWRPRASDWHTSHYLTQRNEGKNYMKCVMARVCELWKRVISHQSFFNESMGITLSNGSLALPRKILERILFETMKCSDHMFLILGLVCKLWYQMTKTN